MRLESGRLRLSATDLSNHLVCGHLSQLKLRVAHGDLEPPRWKDPALELLWERGRKHEKAYLDHLRAEGRDVIEIDDPFRGDAVERTRAAAEAGHEVIFQAALTDGRYFGLADFLVRVDGKSDLGDFRYEVVDTKLAMETRGGTVLQLCLYADLLHGLQGEPAEWMAVVKPGEGFTTERLRFADYAAYYRFVRAKLERFVEGSPDVYPAPVLHCDVCQWWKRCKDRRERDDHLSRVAGMQAVQSGELVRQGIDTLTEFAEEKEPLREPPKRGQRETYEGLQEQARVQLEGQRQGKPEVMLLPVEAGKGLTRLPAPSPGDLFLDFEGNHYVEGGGLEYLLGYAYFDGGGTLQYHSTWALDRGAEKRMVEEFIDSVIARLREHPGLYIYHYAPYEPAALKRLTSRHATREDKLDWLLRGERFIDLFGVTRQGLRASVESYSLKPMEEIFGYEREVKLREEASPALRSVAWALETGTPGDITAEERAAVEGYNRDDCLSLVRLRDWLEQKRAVPIGAGATVERPELKDGTASEGVEEKSAAAQEVFDALVAGIPDDPSERSAAESGRWLLAHLIEYFRREDRVAWWEYHNRREASREDQFKDRKALVGLEFMEDLGPLGKDRSPTHRYRFAPQEASFDVDDDVRDLDAADWTEDAFGSVRAFDPSRGIIEVKKRKKSLDVHPRAIHVFERVTPKPLDGSLLELARALAASGLNTPAAEYRCAADLLLHASPRTRTPREPNASLIAPGETAELAALRIANDLDGGVLAMQGPPGAGKTHNGGRLILKLARDGRHRVGVTATSHKVIRNLLDQALRTAKEEETALQAAHKGGDEPEETGLTRIQDNDKAIAALDAGHVVGGTAWLWARDDAASKLDYLFIDEAGQMSLAHVLACARAARNLILLGDPQQLQQPQRGAHPEGAEISALNHLLGEHKTMPPALGLFLEETWRLPPSICRFTSELYYEGRLHSRAGREQQVLTGPTRFAGNGLFLVPSEHRDNQSSAPEEVEAVSRVVDDLLRSGVEWVDDKGDSHPLQAKDILVIAPYNAQVAALARRRPDLPIGTVDRFQGQGEPVVIYSMTSSSAEDAPRGLSFLYDPHRLNVATSRAKCACILVAAPALFEPDCRTPEEIMWANGLCRYREMATEITLPDETRPAPGRNG